MTKTVVIVNDSGYLTDAVGVNKELNSRYSKFAQRMLGLGSSIAELNFGWNGATKLNICKNGVKGEQITLNAESIVIPGTLTVNGKLLNDIINACTDLAIRGISATDGETTVTITENDVGTRTDIPRLSCVIGLDPTIINRIATVEEDLRALFRFEEVYRVGDGLKVDRTGDKNYLSVNIGTGIRYSETSDSDEDTARIELDFDTKPTRGSLKPVTSDGIYTALNGRSASNLYIDFNGDGNMVLCRYNEDSSGEDSSSDET